MSVVEFGSAIKVIPVPHRALGGDAMPDAFGVYAKTTVPPGSAFPVFVGVTVAVKVTGSLTKDPVGEGRLDARVVVVASRFTVWVNTGESESLKL
jgi:hypothetical protein